MINKRLRQFIEQISDDPDLPLTQEVKDLLYEYTRMVINQYVINNLYRSSEMAIKYAPLLIKAGEVLPLEVASVIAKEYSSGYGYALAYEGKLEIGKELADPKSEFDPGAICEFLGTFKEHTKLLWFCKSDNPILEEDLQPFELIDGEIVACFTGDFTQYSKAGSTHTNEALAADEIKKKALKLWKGNGSNMDEFARAMDDDKDDTCETMYNWIPENAAIVVLTSSGKPFGGAKPEEWEQEYPWGWAYGSPSTSINKPEEPKKETDNSKKPVFSFKKNGDTKATKEPNKKDEKDPILVGKFEVVKTQPGFHLAKKDTSEDFIDQPDNAIYSAPPKQVDTKERVQAWYKAEAGFVPRNWKDRPYIISKSQAVKDLKDLKNTSSSPALQTGGKDASNHFIPPPKLASKEIIKHFLEVDYPKILGNNSEFIQNPKFIEEEAKEPTLAALINNTHFTDISSFDFPRMARCYLLSHIGGPGSEFWVAFADNIWKDNIQARHSLVKQLQDEKNKVTKVEVELKIYKDAEEAAAKAKEPTKAAEPEAPAPKFSFKRK